MLLHHTTFIARGKTLLMEWNALFTNTMHICACIAHLSASTVILISLHTFYRLQIDKSLEEMYILVIFIGRINTIMLDKKCRQDIRQR